MAQGQQAGAQRLGFGVGEIGQAAGLAATAGQPDPQLGQTEDSGEAGADGVDRLDLAQWDALGGPADQAALDPQDSAFDPPSRDQPGDHPEHEDHDESSKVGKVAAQRSPLTAEQREEHEDDDRDRAPPGPHQR